MGCMELMELTATVPTPTEDMPMVPTLTPTELTTERGPLMLSPRLMLMPTCMELTASGPGPVAVSSIQVGISISLGLSISGPLSVVSSVGVRVGTIGVSSIGVGTVAISTIGSIQVGISISLGLRISRPLSVVSSIGVGTVAVSSIQIGISLGLWLTPM